MKSCGARGSAWRAAMKAPMCLRRKAWPRPPALKPSIQPAPAKNMLSFGRVAPARVAATWRAASSPDSPCSEENNASPMISKVASVAARATSTTPGVQASQARRATSEKIGMKSVTAAGVNTGAISLRWLRHEAPSAPNRPSSSPGSTRPSSRGLT
jgi:hypothetical protein